MMEIQKRQFKNILLQLGALGAKYHIEVEGETFANMEVTVKKAKPEPKYHKDMGRYKHLNISDRLSKMTVGDVEVFDGKGLDLRKLQAVVSGNARAWGNGNHTTCQDKAANSVQIMRLG